MNKLLLCCDLDRTLLPNGSQEESPQARSLFRAVARHPQLTLAYVSGRDKSLLLEAIRDYDLPPPDYAIGDVGTSIYELHGDQWTPLRAWEKEIALDWAGNRHDDLVSLFKDIDRLTLQEAEKQGAFKLSYYVPEDTERDGLLAEMTAFLRQNELQASLIWSVDEGRHVGLLDVLPHRATKVHAIRFLMARTGFKEENTIFAGDSGNDLPVLTSGLKSVLVHNARREVQEEAMLSVCKQGFTERLYIAHGDFLGMNGNYAAGVLEGLVHFYPETLSWFKPD